jgi:hypothetical protein
VAVIMRAVSLLHLSVARAVSLLHLSVARLGL